VIHADRPLADAERTPLPMLSVTVVMREVIRAGVRFALAGLRREAGTAGILLSGCRDAAARQLGRLLLVTCTVIGVAALHTIGHATATGEHTTLAAASSSAIAGLIGPSNLVADTTSDGGCDGDGCTHQIALPDGGRGTASWWEVCVAILSALAVAVLAAGILRLLHTIRVALVADGWRPPPFAWVSTPLVGLTVAATAILRI